MTAKAEQIDSQLVHFALDFPDRLSCVGMEQNIAFSAKFGNLLQRLDRTNAMTRVNDADQTRVVSNRLRELVDANLPVLVTARYR